MASLDDLMGESAGILALRQKVRDLLQRLAVLRRMPPILIQGETGTGKTLLARLIHQASARAGGPFVDVNCAEIAETILERELFGHERHAYTEAGPGRPGLFQAAHGGVLFLDEIGLMSTGLQAKVLKVLDEGTVRRLGATRSEPVNVAIVAATNEDLRAAMREKRFREDLYGRIAVLTLELPPLRARVGDVELLADRFLARECERYGLPPKTLGEDARAALRAYSWPRNVRELRNTIERVVLEVDARTVTADALGLPAAPALPGEPEPEPEADARERLRQALTRTGWNLSRTATVLGISRNTVKARIQRYALRPGAPAGPPAAPPGPRAERSAAAAGQGEARAGTPARSEPVVAPGAPARPVAVRWERRRVTLLRARIRSDAGLSIAATAPVLDGLVEQVRSFGGRVEELSPRGLVALFGLAAAEGTPRRAANAALAIVKGLERDRADGVLPAGLAVGVAIHVTQVLLAELGETVALDEDAKAEAWAILDQLTTSGREGIAVSGTAVPLLGRQFEIARDVEAVAWLVGRAPADVTFAAEFVGRHRELALLQSLVERAVEGRGQMVSIVGDPGIGKSRLVHEFLQTLAPDTVTVLRGRCSSHGTTVPYHLVLDVLRDICGVQEDDPPPVIDAKAREALVRMEVDRAPWAGDILNLLRPMRTAPGRPAPEIAKDRTFDALQALVVERQERQPLVIVIEDLHWIDGMSADLLAAVAEIAVRTRILLVCTSRPGHPLPWAGHSHVSQVALAPLPPDASRRLIESALGERPVGRVMVDAILARAEGNPFFLEELARALRDEDRPDEMRIPETVHDVLENRILRLASADRQVLQAAAVIGRELRAPLLEAVCVLPPDDLRASLSRLQAGELLHAARLGPDAGWMFNHALTWEVAYESLLDEDRRGLHRQVVAAIERLYATRLSDHVERLAEHAQRGGLWESAVTFARQAGLKAIGHSAYRDAVTRFTQALAALGQVPATRDRQEQAIDLRLDLRSALLPLGEFSRMLEALRDAAELAEGLGDAGRTARVGAYLADYYRQIGEYEQAVAIGERALAAAHQAGDLSLRVAAGIYLGLAYQNRGQYRRAADLLAATAAAIVDEQSGERFGLPYLPAAHIRTWLASCLGELGEFDRALLEGQRALQFAEGADHPASIASARTGLGRTFLRRGQIALAGPELERAEALAREWKLRLFLPMILESLGIVCAATGQPAKALALATEALETGMAMRGSASASTRWSALSLVHALAGRVGDAQHAAARALELADKHGERGHRAYALHGVATAALRAGDAAAAARAYREGLAVAEELEMRPLAARCHLGLATALERLQDPDGAAHHRSIGERELEAMAMLTPIEVLDP